MKVLPGSLKRIFDTKMQKTNKMFYELAEDFERLCYFDNKHITQTESLVKIFKSHTQLKIKKSP